MEQIQNYSSVVIDLSGDSNAITSVTKTATYGQAFLGEDFSDARGDGRKRRQKRKLEKVSNKRELRTEKRKLKSDRQEERLDRRKTRKTARNEMRDTQQESRMGRKAKRKGEDEEEDDDTSTASDSDTASDSGSLPSDSDSKDTSSDSSSDTASDSSSDSGSGSSDSSSNSEDEDSESSDSSESSDDDNFAGEESNFVSELTGKTPISPMVQTICLKIEWNNEMISRLMTAKQKMEQSGADTSKVTDALGQKFDRVKELETKLENFAGADGKKDRKKEREIKQARNKARAKRMVSVIPPVLIANMLKKGYDKSQIKNWWETKGKHKFAKKNFEGTSDSFGTNDQAEVPIDIAYWETQAYDSKEANEVMVDLDNANEPMMNFGGSDSGSGSTMWRTLLIGGIVGFTAIYFIRKYKLLK
jgi:hypothetical protein